LQKKGLRISESINTAERRNFVASRGWFCNFIRRNNLTMRRGTHAAQLSVCDEEAIKKIRNDFKALVDLHNYELGAIANHDQTPIVHETVILNTIEQKGAKQVPILTSGQKKKETLLL